MQLTRRGAARLTSLAVLSSFALAGCNHPQTTDTSSVTSPTGGSGAVATITTPKGAVLTISQPMFFAQLQGFVPNSPPSATSPQGSYAPPGQPAGRLVLGQMLQGLMLEGLAQDQGVAPTDADVNAEYDSFKALQQLQLVKPFDQALADAGLSADLVKSLQLRPQLTQLRLATKGATVSDADIQKFYDASKDKAPYTSPARVHINRLVFSSLADAQAAASAIKGGKPFDSQVANAVDKLPADVDVPNWVPLDPIPPALASVIKPIADAKIGQVTAPLAVPNGPGGHPSYWLVKVVDRKEKETLPLDQVKEFVRARVLQEKVQADPMVQQTLQQSLRDFQAHVKINIAETRYASLAQQLTQPAPAAPAGGASPFAPAHP